MAHGQSRVIQLPYQLPEAIKVTCSLGLELVVFRALSNTCVAMLLQIAIFLRYKYEHRASGVLKTAVLFFHVFCDAP